MKEYPKIQSIYKRDEKTHQFFEGQYSLPEFEYLKDNKWVATEKVDGTNIRVIWTDNRDRIFVPPQWVVEFKGKTDNAQTPSFLLDKLKSIFIPEKMKEAFGEAQACLYGEGYGARIQKGGGNYIKDGVDFVLIDIKIDTWWLQRDKLEEIANKLGIKIVPVVGEFTLDEAIEFTKGGFNSTWGKFPAEGIVLKPKVDLFTRKGERIITKMKTKDWSEYPKKE